MEEKWVTTYLSSFYEVSNLGRVRSVNRERPWRFGKTQFIKGKQKSGRKEKAGYILFDLMNSDGIKKTVRVHQLVYHSFSNTIPKKGMVVDHIDGDKSNNRLDNLQFITHTANCAKGKMHTERKNKLPLYIKTSNTSTSIGYRVVKKINSKQHSFGRFPTLEEAIAYRDMLIKNNWIVQ